MDSPLTHLEFGPQNADTHKQITLAAINLLVAFAKG
jgi:hypothetical protein